MRALRCLLVVVLSGLLTAIPATAQSAEVAEHGWWWRYQTGLFGVELPPPPDVPSDGMVVERAADGSAAISALRFALAQGEVAPVLTLQAASFEGGDATIAACPTRTRWQSEQVGAWSRAPGVDCEAGQVDGVRNDDGTWSWDLTGLVREDGVVDVALVDAGTAPFRVVFDAPGEDAVQVSSRPSPPPPPPPVTSTSGGGGTTSAIAPAPAFAPPPVAGSVPAPVAPDVAPESAPEVAPDPVAPGPDTTAGAPVPATEPGPSVIAWALLALVAALVAVELGAAVRGRGDTAAAWRRERRGVGGIGRFSREREQAPEPLW